MCRHELELLLANNSPNAGTNAPAFIWAIVEVCVAILCASIPTFATLVTMIARKRKERSTYPSDRSGEDERKRGRVGRYLMGNQPGASNGRRSPSATLSNKHLAPVQDVELRGVGSSEDASTFELDIESSENARTVYNH